jgi:hypothetical protein
MPRPARPLKRHARSGVIDERGIWPANWDLDPTRCPRCKLCGERFVDSTHCGGGRQPIYCSDRCRQRAHRRARVS